jgi:tetratricopeptide (TPR) repeat protein
MSNQEALVSSSPALVAPPVPEHCLDSHLERYRQALDVFERDPKKLLRALIARDRVDAELRRQAGPGDMRPAPDRELHGRRLADVFDRLGRDHPSYEEALIYQHRLVENLDQANHYGETETLRAERARIVYELNSLALAALGVPFTELGEAAQARSPTTGDGPSDRVVALDGHLRRLAFRQFKALGDLAAWRKSFSPPVTAWWWQLDQQFEAQEQEHDLPWQLGAALCTVISLTVSVEIIRRLWTAAPDAIAVFGTIVTLLLTGSPLHKRGPELGQWVLKRLPRLNPRFRGEATFGMAALALIVVLSCWFSLPALGTLYNNWGHTALDGGNLAAAEQWYRRATALNPELSVAYYNLAEFYKESGSSDDAIRWYRTSIERDRLFRPAYFGLGALYNEQGRNAEAERVLLAGLNIKNPREDQTLVAYSDYKLLSNLGWAFFAQGRFARAEEILLEALRREDAVGEEDRSMLPHYYLARVYCRSQRPQAALDEIRETLRFGGQNPWEDQIWTATVNDYLSAVQAGEPACTAMPILHRP